MCDLIRESEKCLLQHADEVAGALVYLDEGFGETARDAWGLGNILDLGAINVCSLESAAPQDLERSEVLAGRPIEKVVIFLSKLLHESYPEILRLLASFSGVASCTILTTVSEETYSRLAPPEMRLYPFESYRERLGSELQGLSSSGARQCSLQIKCCPLAFCPLSAKFFKTPIPPVLRQQLGEDLDAASSAFYASDDFDLTDYEEDLSPGLTFLARTISEMCSQLSWDAHLFAQGRIAKVLAKEVASTDRKRGRRQTPQHVSLVLLDRALDLITPLCHIDSNLDRLQSNEGEATNAIQFTAGSLCQPSDENASNWFGLLCNNNAKDFGFAIRKELKSVLLEEKIPNEVETKLGAVSTEELSRLKASIESSKSRRQKYATLLQYADLVMKGNQHDLVRKWEFLIALEKIIMHLALDQPDKPMQYLLELVANTKRGSFHLLGVEDLVRLICMSHILVSLHFGESQSHQHLDGDMLQEVLTDLYLSESRQQKDCTSEEDQDKSKDQIHKNGKKNKKKNKNKKKKTPKKTPKKKDEGIHSSTSSVSEEEIRGKVTRILERLRRATSVCCKLNREGSLSLVELNSGDFKPLVSCIFDLLVDANNDSQQDSQQQQKQEKENLLQYVPGSIGGLLASGLGRFGIMKDIIKPKISDGDIVVIYIVGNVSPLELKLSQEAASKWASHTKCKKNILIGGLDVAPAKAFARDTLSL